MVCWALVQLLPPYKMVLANQQSPTWNWWAFIVQADKTPMPTTHSAASTAENKSLNNLTQGWTSWFHFISKSSPLNAWLSPLKRTWYSKRINLCIYHFCPYPTVPSLGCKCICLGQKDVKPKAHPCSRFSLRAVKSGYGAQGQIVGPGKSQTLDFFLQ